MSLSKLIAGCALVSSTLAGAVTVTSAPGAPDPGPFANQLLVVTFDAANAPGYSFSGDLTTTAISSNSGAAPAMDATVFGYVSSAVGTGSATLSTPNLSAISFYWGSIDTYNFVDVLGAGGSVIATIVGGSIPPANGDQTSAGTNRRVNISADAGEVITGLTLRSTGVAFEFDDFAATAAVPEPATWAMMVLGFGMVGFGLRRRGTLVVAA